MILLILIVLLFLGGCLSWLFSKKKKEAAFWIALITVLIDLILVVGYWIKHPTLPSATDSQWIAELNAAWIPELGIRFHLAADGLSLVMAALTLFIGVASVLASRKEIKEKTGFFYFHTLFVLAGILGVFFSLDLLLFYFFWEVMLIPMFFMMFIWGGNRKRYASLKFFLFTQLSGLLMLLAILGLYFVHGQQTGQYSFDYFDLLGTSFTGGVGFWLMAGFLIAFLVKLPSFPFHSWLPDAYVQAPTAGSIILAALMTKTAAYGMLRFVLPLFPEAAHDIAPLMMLLGVTGILYGAKVAYAQNDLKRLISFSSFSHMGFILIGIFSFQPMAYMGTILEMVAHGISICALFIISGALFDRTDNRILDKMGGFREKIPKMGGFTLVFVMATLGLPGLGNFIAEFLILAGVLQTSILWAVLAAIGLIAAMIYALRIVQPVFHGQLNTAVGAADQLYKSTIREKIIMTGLIVSIIWVGIFPGTIINTVRPVVKQIKHYTDLFRDTNTHLPQEANPTNEKDAKRTFSYRNHPPTNIPLQCPPINTYKTGGKSC